MFINTNRLGRAWEIRSVLALAGFLVVTGANPVAAQGVKYCHGEGWPQLPDRVNLGQVAGTAVGSDQTVYVFHRGEKNWGGGGRFWTRVQNFLSDLREPSDQNQAVQAPTVLALRPETGELISAFGADQFLIPHGLAIDADSNIWLTDVGLHQVFKMSKTGEVLLTVGEAGVPGDDQTHFDRPTDVAVAPDGSFYVADGYGNARIVKFSAAGKYLFEWGGQGSAPGQFDTPHGIAIGQDQKIYVADRGNGRLQVFDGTGKFLAQYAGAEIGRPWAVDVTAEGRIYVADGGDLGSGVSRSGLVILSPDGQVVVRWSQFGYGPGELVWPHDLAVGSNSEVYVGEVLDSHRVQKFIANCPE